MTFENAMKRLEEIIASMEQGNASLEESLALFEEGTGLVKQCSKTLDEAEMKIVRLMKGQNGEPVETEMEIENEG